MIKIKGNKIIFTGKDDKIIRKYAKRYQMSVRDFVIGTLWRQLMNDKEKEINSRCTIANGS